MILSVNEDERHSGFTVQAARYAQCSFQCQWQNEGVFYVDAVSLVEGKVANRKLNFVFSIEDKLQIKENVMLRSTRRSPKLLLAGLLILVLAALSPVASTFAQGTTCDGEVIQLAFWNYWGGVRAPMLSDVLDRFNQTHPASTSRTSRLTARPIPRRC